MKPRSAQALDSQQMAGSAADAPRVSGWLLGLQGNGGEGQQRDRNRDRDARGLAGWTSRAAAGAGSACLSACSPRHGWQGTPGLGSDAAGSCSRGPPALLTPLPLSQAGRAPEAAVSVPVGPEQGWCQGWSCLCVTEEGGFLTRLRLAHPPRQAVSWALPATGQSRLSTGWAGSRPFGATGMVLWLCFLTPSPRATGPCALPLIRWLPGLALPSLARTSGGLSLLPPRVWGAWRGARV